MVATLVWHNKYLGDKYDQSIKAIDPVEVDTYLTGAKHLLMSNSVATLENAENMTEADYRSKIRNPLQMDTDPKTKAKSWKELTFWDMFYYGRKFQDTSGNPLPSTHEAVVHARKYVEKNTYYRELYGLPEYNGTICHCNECEYEAYNMSVCPRCGSSGSTIDWYHSAPSMYSYIAQFPRDNTKSVQEKYYLYAEDGSIIINQRNDPDHPFNEDLPETDRRGARLDFNPRVFIYERPKIERMYAAHTVSFVDDRIAETKNDRHYRYLSHMTYAKIHPFVARLSDRFEILYLADSEISFMNTDFREGYENCRLFMKYRYYTEAFRNQYEEYEGFIGMAIMFMALERMQSKYLEADITRDFYDRESIEVVYNAYSVPFYDEIPLTYHNKIIKAINRLISIKGTNKCFREIFAIFGYSTLNMYQYYILKTQKRDGSGKPMFSFDANGNEIPENMYDVQIVKADIGENPYTYILDSLNYLDYYSVTDPDTYWINDEDLLYKLYHSDYNFIETKYIGIQMAFSLTRLTIETEYLMRMLLDNRYNGTDTLSMYHGKLGRNMTVYDLVIYIMYIVGTELNLENGGSLAILSDPAKLSAIYGFNFLEDFTEVYGYLSRKFIYNYRAGFIIEKPGVIKSTDGTETDTISKYFHSTDYSDIDIMQPLSDDIVYSYEYTVDGQTITKDMTINDIMYNESNINNIKRTDINSFFSKFNEYISDKDVDISPNGVELHLVYAFNTIRKLLTQYTSDEIQLKDILSEKFTTMYWSPEVCAYCGMSKSDISDQYTYCHNLECISYHMYEDGEGPRLIDQDGNIPDVKAVDTSKDTLKVQIRNRVFADFVHKFSNVNPLIRTCLSTFEPYTRIYVNENGSIDGYTYDLRETIDKRITYYVSNDRNLYIDYDSAYDIIENVKSDNEVTITYTDDDFNTYEIHAYVLYVNTDPVVIQEPGSGTEYRYIRVVLDREINIPEDAINIVASIKYRTLNISFDEWHEMMMSGVVALRYMNIAFERYMMIRTAREEDPESYTEYEMFEAYNIFTKNEYVYENTLYYLLNILASFIDSENDIDLDAIKWKYRYWDDLPEDVSDIRDNQNLRLMPSPSELYVDKYINYVGETVYRTIVIDPETGETHEDVEYMKDSIYKCVVVEGSDPEEYEWQYYGPYSHTALNSIKSELESIDMYMPIIGLRSKHEFNLYISDQISKLTPIVCERSNGDTDTVPPEGEDYEYTPPYYDKLNDVELVRWYLYFYFMDNKSLIDTKDRSSQLAKVVDDFYLEDHLHFVSDYKYGAIDDVNADTSFSYMNEKMWSVRNGTKSIKIFDYIKTYIRDILTQDDTIQNTHEITIGINKPADEFEKLRESYASITDLYRAFIELTWNAKDPKTFYAIRRLRKMLMTTRYASEIYALKGTESKPKVAESYRELLDSIDPVLTSRIDNMTESQRISELEYSLDCLSKCADDLIYIHAYGGFNMKKIISYIFKLLLFFKSAKVDLLDYALEFHIDDKTDNMIKYMSELTKLSTKTTMSPDKWRFTDYMAEHSALIRLNSDKSDRISFFDLDSIMLMMRYVRPQSPLYLMDQVAHHYKSTVVTADLNYNLSDSVKNDINNVLIDPRYDTNRAFKYYLYMRHLNESDPNRYTQYDVDMAYLAYLEKLKAFNNNCQYDRNIRFGDNCELVKRVVYKLDYDAAPESDAYGNLIYPKKLDEYNLPVRVITTDYIKFNNESEE
jgi:hypothetical protein